MGAHNSLLSPLSTVLTVMLIVDKFIVKRGCAENAAVFVVYTA